VAELQPSERTPKGGAKAMARVGFRNNWHGPGHEKQGDSGTFETNDNSCPVAFEQAIQRGMKTAWLLSS
jgi:hypothetical protein